jgi:hypothetical protein
MTFHPSRRFVLLGGGLGLGAAMLGIRRIRDVVAATPDESLRFVHVYLNGGWDVTLGPTLERPAPTPGSTSAPRGWRRSSRRRSR